MRRTLALLLFLAAPALLCAQSIQPTDNPNQINVTPGWLYLNKMHYSGTWSSTTTYNNQDVVTYSGSTYISNGSYNLGINPSASAIWWTPIGGASSPGTGSVSSVGLSAPSSLFSVGGTNPITTTGTFTLALNAQSANQVFAGPSTGGAAVPTFRNLLKADLPALTIGSLMQKGDGFGGLTPATFADIFNLFSGCSGIMYAGFDGACHNPTGTGATIPRVTNIIQGDGNGNAADTGVSFPAGQSTVGSTLPIVVTQATTFYVCPLNFATCAYNGDGGTAAQPSDSYTLVQAQNKATPWATLARAAAALQGATLKAPIKIQKADTAQTSIIGTINSSATTITVATPNILANNDYFELDQEILQCTAGCAGTTWTVTRAQSTTTAVAHTNSGVTRLVSGYVYQDNAYFSAQTLGAYPYSFIEPGQLNGQITDQYPTSYIEIAGNDTDQWRSISTSANPITGGTVAVGGIRVQGANAVFHGFAENFVGYQVNVNFEAFVASITCNGFVDCFEYNLATLNDAGQGSVLVRAQNGAFFLLGPNNIVRDSGYAYAECCSTQMFSHTPAGWMTLDSVISSNATGSNSKTPTTFFVNEGGQIHIWGPTTMNVQSPGRSILYGGLTQGSNIDNVENGTFGASTVNISNAAGLVYASMGTAHLYDACGANSGNVCTITGSIRQRANTSVGGYIALGLNAWGATETVASTATFGGHIGDNPFNAPAHSVDVNGDLYLKGNNTPCSIMTPTANDGQICFDYTNGNFLVQSGSSTKAYLNTNDSAFTNGALVVAANTKGKTATGNLTGDVSTSGTTAATVTKINGTTVPTNAAADQALITTASATGAWASLTNCGDTSHGLSYNTTTHSFGCANITGSAAAASFPVDSAQSTAYTVLAGDFSSCKVIPVSSGTFTVTLLGTAPTAGQCIWVVNYGSGVVTIGRNGLNINGAAANVTLPGASSGSPTGAFIISDGANYMLQTLGAGISGGVSSVDGSAGTGVETIQSGSVGAITSSGTLRTNVYVNNQNPPTSDAYSVVDGDRAKLITNNDANQSTYTLPTAGTGGSFVNGWYADFENRGTGLMAITTSTSTIDGKGTIWLGIHGKARVISDGSNYYTSGYSGPGLIYAQWANTAANCFSPDGGTYNTFTCASANATDKSFPLANFTYPANFLDQYRNIRIHMFFGVTGSASPPSLTMKVLLGGTAVFQSNAGAIVSSLSNYELSDYLDMMATAAPGASVSIEANTSNSNLPPRNIVTFTSGLYPSVATNASLAQTITANWAGATAGNYIQLRGITIEVLN